MDEEKIRETGSDLAGDDTSHQCLRCGRPLTSAKSIEKKMGPTCAKKMAVLLGKTDQGAMFPEETKAELDQRGGNA